MAYMTIGYFSNALHRRAQLTVILPVDKAGIGEPFAADPHDGKPYKTLYLLHGIFGDNLSWPMFSRVQRVAEANNLCVVMPSGENGFYIDHPDTYDNYATLCGQEIVDVTRRMFPLSRKREDTFIGGFSMGGYGALRLGLLNSDTFGAITAMSSGLLLEEYVTKTETGSPADNFTYMKAMFGDPDKVLESDLNPEWLIKQLKAAGKPIPKLYLSCGEQDFLIKNNNRFVEFLKKEGVPYTYRTAPGMHDWDFWDADIDYVIKNWLPVEGSSQSLSAEELPNQKKN